MGLDVFGGRLVVTAVDCGFEIQILLEHILALNGTQRHERHGDGSVKVPGLHCTFVITEKNCRKEGTYYVMYALQIKRNEDIIWV